MREYYQVIEHENHTDIYIYGDITSQEWDDSDVSSYSLSQRLEQMDTENINLYINSYGGEVKEGLAIYNQLTRHKAKITTWCDGFACSAASVIFMAGDERIMYDSSLLMIHNAWTYSAGNSQELRKQADDLETITNASVHSYMKHVTITEEELKGLMDAETWIDSQQALEQGFTTSTVEARNLSGASQSVKEKVLMAMKPKRGITIKLDEEQMANIHDEIQAVLAEVKQQLAVEPEVEPEPKQEVEPETTLLEQLFKNYMEEK